MNITKLFGSLPEDGATISVGAHELIHIFDLGENGPFLRIRVDDDGDCAYHIAVNAQALEEDIADLTARGPDAMAAHTRDAVFGDPDRVDDSDDAPEEEITPLRASPESKEKLRAWQMKDLLQCLE